MFVCLFVFLQCVLFGGRQKKRWKDTIREWTGLEFAKSKRAVGNREKKRRKLVVKSSVVPQQLSQLMDR